MSMKRSLITLAVALMTVAVAPPAAAQTPDSALAVTRNGMSLFRLNADGGLVIGGQYDGGIHSGGIAREGAGTRLLWYPQKAAFRAGYINGTQWDDPNIGYFSVAIGENVRASGDNSTAFGLGSSAGGQSTFAAGERATATGAASVAMGYNSHTNARQGSFVFGDRSTTDTIRAGVNHSANWRVSGGFRVFTSSSLNQGVTIQSGATVSNWGQSSAVISTSTGAYLHTNGSWVNNSDASRKRLHERVSGEDLLMRLGRMPIWNWSYLTEDETVRHIGPTAQDFMAAFGLGTDDATISTVDATGVGLAAAQALDARSRQQADELAQLRQQNAELRAEVAAMAARVAQIEALLAAQAQSSRQPQ